jgi:hypothetical protein
MDYNESKRADFETVVDVESNHQLDVSTFVEPDAVVVSDGESTVRVSKGEDKNQAFLEIDGQTKTVDTTAKNRTDSVRTVLRELARDYSGNLENDALNL